MARPTFEQGLVERTAALVGEERSDAEHEDHARQAEHQQHLPPQRATGESALIIASPLLAIYARRSAFSSATTKPQRTRHRPIDGDVEAPRRWILRTMADGSAALPSRVGHIHCDVPGG